MDLLRGHIGSDAWQWLLPDSEGGFTFARGIHFTRKPFSLNEAFTDRVVHLLG